MHEIKGLYMNVYSAHFTYIHIRVYFSILLPGGGGGANR